MGMLRAMIRAPSCLLGLLLALVPVSQAVADCTDPPGPGVTWRRCVFDRLEFPNVNLTGAELRDASFLRADLSGATLTMVGAFLAKHVNTTLTGDAKSCEQATSVSFLLDMDVTVLIQQQNT